MGMKKPAEKAGSPYTPYWHAILTHYKIVSQTAKMCNL